MEETETFPAAADRRHKDPGLLALVFLAQRDLGDDPQKHQISCVHLLTNRTASIRAFIR